MSSQAGISSIVFKMSCSITVGSGGSSRDLPVLKYQFASVWCSLQWVHHGVQWMRPVITVGAPCTFSGYAL